MTTTFLEVENETSLKSAFNNGFTELLYEKIMNEQLNFIKCHANPSDPLVEIQINVCS